MTSKNDITGDSIRSKIGSSNKAYADGWEKAFGKKDKQPEQEKTDTTKDQDKPVDK